MSNVSDLNQRLYLNHHISGGGGEADPLCSLRIICPQSPPPASLSQLTCVWFLIGQTPASCGTETSSLSGTPASVCLPTLWET